MGIAGNFLREKHTRMYGAQEQPKASQVDRRMRSTWEKTGRERPALSCP